MKIDAEDDGDDGQVHRDNLRVSEKGRSRRPPPAASTSLTGRPSASAAAATSSYSGWSVDAARRRAAPASRRRHGRRRRRSPARGRARACRPAARAARCVEVCRKTSRRTASARSAATSTESVWAGRPFFIRIGVSQASDGPGRQQRGDHGRPEPRVEVVDVGLEQQRASGGRAGAAVRWSSLSSPDQQPQHVRVPRRVAAARTDDRSRSTVIAGCAPVPVALAISRAAPVGVQSSTVDRSAVRRDATEQLRDRRGRHREPAVSGADVTAADRDRGDHEVLQRRGVPDPAQAPTTSAIASSGPDLVEVHVVDRGTVHDRLGLGQPRERRERPGAHAASSAAAPAGHGRPARCGASPSRRR